MKLIRTCLSTDLTLHSTTTGFLNSWVPLMSNKKDKSCEKKCDSPFQCVLMAEPLSSVLSPVWPDSCVTLKIPSIHGPKTKSTWSSKRRFAGRTAFVLDVERRKRKRDDSRFTLAGTDIVSFRWAATAFDVLSHFGWLCYHKGEPIKKNNVQAWDVYKRTYRLGNDRMEWRHCYAGKKSARAHLPVSAGQWFQITDLTLLFETLGA